MQWSKTLNPRTLLATALTALSLEAAAQCSLQVQSVAFGSYDPFSSVATDGVSTIRVSCSGARGQPINYSIAISKGGAAYHPRTMSRGSHLLRYNLYQNPARTIVWGDTSESTVTVVDSYVLDSTQGARSYPVYGRIFPHQNVRTGHYTDSLIVTLSF